jgi:hypothetical protein
MSSDTAKLAQLLHLPLRRVALCLDCEECFELGCSVCPACGSETWMPLARFLELEASQRRGSGLEDDLTGPLL